MMDDDDTTQDPDIIDKICREAGPGMAVLWHSGRLTIIPDPNARGQAPGTRTSGTVDQGPSGSTS